MKRLLCNFALSMALVSAVAVHGSADDREAAGAKAQASTRVAATSKKNRLAASKKDSAPVKRVEMFEAMDQGILAVEYIGKNSTEANLIFRNKGDEALEIVLPETFGALPVVTQGMGMGMGGGGMGGMGGGGMGGMGGGGMGGGGMGGGGQGMGGGMGGGGMGGGGMGGMGGGMGGMGGGGMGMGGGMMRVEADRPRKLTVATLCLEHGKPDPNPRMKYRVVRLSEVNPNPEIAELCKAVAAGQVPQNTAQAAAWHIANGLSWEELASKPRMISEYTGIEYYFNRGEIQNALRLTSMAKLAAENSAATTGSNSSFSAPTTGESALLVSPGEEKSK
ncbi:MAG: hypothetical protein ACK5OB_08140 [Pirellula sp.]